MENKRYTYFIFESDKPVYLKKENLLDIIKKFPYFEITYSNVTTFKEALKEFLNKTTNLEKKYILINTNNITEENQKQLYYLIKDKSYETLIIPDNIKIIVTGNKDNLNKELLSLLVVIDV